MQETKRPDQSRGHAVSRRDETYKRWSSANVCDWTSSGLAEASESSMSNSFQEFHSSLQRTEVPEVSGTIRGSGRLGSQRVLVRSRRWTARNPEWGPFGFSLRSGSLQFGYRRPLVPLTTFLLARTPTSSASNRPATLARGHQKWLRRTCWRLWRKSSL